MPPNQPESSSWLSSTPSGESARTSAAASIVVSSSRRHERALQPLLGAEPLQEHGDRGEFARLVGDGLLRQHQPGGGGEGRDEVERCRAGAPIVAAARGLAVDRHEAGLVGPALPHPVREGGGEERGVDPVHQDGEPAFAGHAVRVGQVPAEEVEVRGAPGGDVLVVVAVGDGTKNSDEKQAQQERLRWRATCPTTCAPSNPALDARP